MKRFRTSAKNGRSVAKTEMESSLIQRDCFGFDPGVSNSWSRCRLIFCVYLCCVMPLLLIYFDFVSEKSERFIKKSALHNFIQERRSDIDVLGNSTDFVEADVSAPFPRHHFSKALVEGQYNGSDNFDHFGGIDGGTSIVFMHVPRTGGDSLRTHLFGAVQNVTLMDFSKWRFNKDSYKTVGMMRHIYTGLYYAKMSRTKIIKGFLSRKQLDRYRRYYPGKNLRIFTFLRHPIERALSLYTFVTERHDAFSQLSIIDFFTNPMGDPWIDAWTNNSLTFQFGYSFLPRDRVQWIGFTDRNESMDRLLRNAKRFMVENVTSVGFYEDIGKDFYKIKRDIFDDSIEGNRLLEWLWDAGAYLGHGRLRTMKYAARLTPEELRAVYAMNKFDMQLYDFAYKLAGKKFELQESYSDWFHFWRNSSNS